MMSIFTKGRLRVFIIALTCIVIALLVFDDKIKNPNLFVLSSDFFKNDERVSSKIGEVKTVRLNLLGTKLWRDKARIGLKLRGERDDMPVWIWFKKTEDEWIIYEAGIMPKRGVRLNWVPMTIKTPQGAFYALKRALQAVDYEKAWSYTSEWAREGKIFNYSLKNAMKF